jgi:hypothetical protein
MLNIHATETDLAYRRFERERVAAAARQRRLLPRDARGRRVRLPRTVGRLPQTFAWSRVRAALAAITGTPARLASGRS